MFWSFVLLIVMVASSMVSSQPVTCQDDEQCTAKQYCENSAKICRECLDCEDFKREFPAHYTPSSCIKSVSECGSCLKGLVLDHRNDVNVCVTPDDRDGSVFPGYGWALIVIGVVFLVLVVGIVVYLLKNPDSFKILASTRTSFRSPGFRAGAPMNIPDAPPPYNPNYEAVRPESPSTYQLPSVQITREEELSQPFIKRAPPSQPQPQDQRESGDNQSAIPYELPAYARYKQPNSPESATSHEAESDVQENQFTVHDEDTMESNWTSNGDDAKSFSAVGSGQHSNSNSGHSGAVEEGAVGNSGSLPPSNSMALALRETLAGQPPAKKLRTAQDSNNNTNRESNAGNESSDTVYISAPAPASTSASAPTSAHVPPHTHTQTAVVINVQVNNNNK